MYLTADGVYTFPILVVRDGKLGRYGATCLPSKSVTPYAVSYLVGFVRDSGHRRIISRTDNEPSISALRYALVKHGAGIEILPP